MAISQLKAAEIFEHYIRMALERSGVTVTADMSEELTAATAAFEAESTEALVAKLRQPMTSLIIADIAKSKLRNPR